jgi:hypothetical protein
MPWKKVVWSPVEIEYLRAHSGDPLMQLCIALAKSKNAVKKKQAELGNLKTNKQNCLPGNKGQRSKIGKRPDCNNMFFRSGWEANVYRLLRQQPNVSRIEYEPYDFTFWQFGIKKGTVSYTPDFKVTYNDGTIEWIEVKGGFMRGTDKVKLRRFKKYYPEEFARLVSITPGPTSKTSLFFESLGIPNKWRYPDLNKQYKKSVPNWE